MPTSSQFWPVLVRLYNMCNWHSLFNQTSEGLFLDLNMHSDASSKIWWSSLLHPKPKQSAKPNNPLKPVKDRHYFYSVSGKCRLGHRTGGIANWMSGKTCTWSRQAEPWPPSLQASITLFPKEWVAAAAAAKLLSRLSRVRLCATP